MLASARPERRRVPLADLTLLPGDGSHRHAARDRLRRPGARRHGERATSRARSHAPTASPRRRPSSTSRAAARSRARSGRRPTRTSPAPAGAASLREPPPVTRSRARRGARRWAWPRLRCSRSRCSRGRGQAARPFPRPSRVLGFVPGEDRQLADWGQVLAYLHALAAASDRVSVEELGRTTQGRPFVLVDRDLARQPRPTRGDPARRRAARRPARAVGRRGGAARARGRVPSSRWPSRSTRRRWAARSRRCACCTGSPPATTPRPGAGSKKPCCSCCRRTTPTGPTLVADWYRRQLGTPFEGTAPPVLYHPYVGHDNNRDWYMFTQQETRLTVDGALPPLAPAGRARRAPDGRARRPPVRAAVRSIPGSRTSTARSLPRRMRSGRTSPPGSPPRAGAGVVTGALFDAWTPGRA